MNEKREFEPVNLMPHEPERVRAALKDVFDLYSEDWPDSIDVLHDQVCPILHRHGIRNRKEFTRRIYRELLRPLEERMGTLRDLNMEQLVRDLSK